MAGLTFGNLLGSGADWNVAGPQFDMDATKLKRIAYSYTGVGEESVYTVPAGKTLYLSKVLLSNLNGANQNMTVVVDTSTIAYMLVGANSLKEIDFAIPLILTAGEVLKSTGSVAANKIAAVGWEV